MKLSVYRFSYIGDGYDRCIGNKGYIKGGVEYGGSSSCYGTGLGHGIASGYGGGLAYGTGLVHGQKKW